MTADPSAQEPPFDAAAFAAKLFADAAEMARIEFGKK